MHQYRLSFLVSLLMCLAFPLGATTYYPLPLEKQLTESKAVIKGEYQSATYKKAAGGEIVTVASFKIHESIGLKDNEILNRNDFKIIFPGGKWNNMVYTIDGAPTFTPGEQSILILNKSPYGHVLNGLSLGKYEIVKNSEGEVGLASAAFPNHPKLGFISLDVFNSGLSNRFGKKLTSINSDRVFSLTLSSNVRMPASGTKTQVVKKKGRTPASSEDNYQASTESISTFWLICLFAVLGLYPVFFIKKKDI